MGLKAALRSTIKAGRKRGALWVRLLDFARSVATAQSRAVLWTRIVHRGEVHQTTTYTSEERYPALFDFAARLRPDAKRIHSFGCSTGEELISLRRRFPDAEIVGSEINPRCRRIARRRVQDDRRTSVVGPSAIDGKFDIVFALAVLQREPHKIMEMGVRDLNAYYPFSRFDQTVRELGNSLQAGGLLCVANAHYRVEDSSAASQFEPILASPQLEPPLFGVDGLLLSDGVGSTVFRKVV